MSGYRELLAWVGVNTAIGKLKCKRQCTSGAVYVEVCCGVIGTHIMIYFTECFINGLQDKLRIHFIFSCRADESIYQTLKSAKITFFEKKHHGDNVPQAFDIVLFDSFFLILCTWHDIPSTLGNISKKNSTLTATKTLRVDLIFDRRLRIIRPFAQECTT